MPGPIDPGAYAEWTQAPQSGRDLFHLFMANDVTREVVTGGLGNLVAIPMIGLHVAVKHFLKVPRMLVDPVIAVACLLACGYFAVWKLMTLSDAVHVAWVALSVYGTFVGVQAVNSKQRLQGTLPSR